MEPRRVHFAELAPAAPTSLHARESETYRREIGRLLAEGHAGEFVLVHGDSVVGFWPTRKDAVVEGYRRFRTNQFLVELVSEWQVVVAVPFRGTRVGGHTRTVTLPFPRQIRIRAIIGIDGDDTEALLDAGISPPRPQIVVRGD